MISEKLLSVGGFVIGLILIFVAFKLIKWITSLRTVVSTNEVHVVRRGKQTITYGGSDKEKSAGNTYYNIPANIPYFGVNVLVLPLSNFDIDLVDYEAYDKDRLPFNVDIKAFFRISDYTKAAERVESMTELYGQLKSIVQGSVRTILAMSILNDIMEKRSVYGKQFTEEVESQLPQWGCESVKNIEFMNIKDSPGKENISNIMAIKESEINMTSRTERAANERKAREAEITASQAVALREQEKLEIVGQREAEVTRKVGIATQKSNQDIQDETKLTTEKEMNVKQVSVLRTQEIEKERVAIEAEARLKKAEIDKESVIVNSQANKENVEITAEATYFQNVKEAEAKKKTVELSAEAELTKETKKAEGIKVMGDNEASAIKARGLAEASATEVMEVAKQQGNIIWAQEIGSNAGYQTYLAMIRQFEAQQAIGVAQAENLENADIKILTGSADIPGGIDKVSELFTPKGGASIGGALEALAQTPLGKGLLERFKVGDGDQPK